MRPCGHAKRGGDQRKPPNRRDGWTAVTFLQPVPSDAEVVINGAYYLMAMMTNSGEHSH